MSPLGHSLFSLARTLRSLSCIGHPGSLMSALLRSCLIVLPPLLGYSLFGNTHMLLLWLDPLPPVSSRLVLLDADASRVRLLMDVFSWRWRRVHYVSLSWLDLAWPIVCGMDCLAIIPPQKAIACPALRVSEDWRERRAYNSVKLRRAVDRQVPSVPGFEMGRAVIAGVETGVRACAVGGWAESVTRAGSGGQLQAGEREGQGPAGDRGYHSPSTVNLQQQSAAQDSQHST